MPRISADDTYQEARNAAHMAVQLRTAHLGIRRHPTQDEIDPHGATTDNLVIKRKTNDILHPHLPVDQQIDVFDFATKRLLYGPSMIGPQPLPRNWPAPEMHDISPYTPQAKTGRGGKAVPILNVREHLPQMHLEQHPPLRNWSADGSSYNEIDFSGPNHLMEVANGTSLVLDARNPDYIQPVIKRGSPPPKPVRTQREYPLDPKFHPIKWQRSFRGEMEEDSREGGQSASPEKLDRNQYLWYQRGAWKRERTRAQ